MSLTACTIHLNYFDLIHNVFLRCALVDQIAVFRYVDKHVPHNHVVYLLMREILTTNARVATVNKQNGKWNIVGKRNLVVVQDGMQEYDEELLRNIDEEDVDETQRSTTRRKLVRCTRDYATVMKNLMPGMQSIYGQETHSSLIRRKTVKDNDLFALTTTDDDDDNDDDGNDDDDNNNYDHYYVKRRKKNDNDTVRRNRLFNDTGTQRVKAKLRRVIDVERRDDEDDENNDVDERDRDFDDDEENGTTHSGRDRKRRRSSSSSSTTTARNCQKLFSKSSKSVRVFYETAKRAAADTNDRCRESLSMDKDGRRFVHEYEKTCGNNALLPFVSARSRNESVRLTNETTRFALTHRLPDRRSERDVRDPRRPALTDETLHLCATVLDLSASEAEKIDASALWRRVDDVRRSGLALVSKASKTKGRADETKGRADELDVEDDADPRRVDDRWTKSLDNASYTTTYGPQEFRVIHAREYNLDKLITIIDVVQRLAHSRVFDLYDFVFYSEYDAWSTFNRVLDYAIRVHQRHDYFPVKHALTDIAVIDNTENANSRPTQDNLRMDNYDLLWMHDPSLVVGDLIEFVQSFRQFIRKCVTLNTCYFLNQKVMNTRRVAAKHDCVLPKASQGAYYALFLRMNLGHDLLCNSVIETRDEAVRWLQRYETLSDHMWKKKRVPKSKTFTAFVRQLENRNLTTTTVVGTWPSSDRVTDRRRRQSPVYVEEEMTTASAAASDDNGSFLDYDFDDDVDD